MATEAANCTSQTNWTIASGSLLNCITFQSDDDDDSSTSKPFPLLLHSPTPDSPPCEITINFAKKHELRQIYVRSTARVYEIYYAPDLQSNNEYLCTVRCGVATRDGEILRSSSIHEIASSLDRDSGDESARSEDDWLEVKVVDSNRQDLFEATAEVDDMDPCISVTLRLLSLQSKGCVSVDEIYVFADPVDTEIQETRDENSSSSSLMAMFLPTLMQLSKTTGLSHLNSVRKEKQVALEDGFKETPHPSDSVIKDQLNRKASLTDPHEEKLKEVKGGLVGPSQPNTLSQVAKMESDRGVVPSQASDSKEIPHPSDSVIKDQLNRNASLTDPHEEKLKEVKDGLVGPSQPITLSQVAKVESDRCAVPSQAVQMDSNCSAIHLKVAEMENNQCAVPSQVAVNQGDFSGGNVEKALEKLMSRMDRIEEICLGFQEKMVMPMNNIEARLQRVEQQLDTLSKKFPNSELQSGYRISAPDVSCIESDANSFEVCVDSTSTETGEVESEKKYVHAEVLNAAPSNMSDTENTTQLLPGLVVTAPEFPDGEDEDDIASEPEMNSSNDKEKQSIDDALSSALANFLSSSLSSESPKYTKTVTVKAPEFSNEDDDDHESNNEAVKNDSVHLTDSKKCSHAQVLASSRISFESGEDVNNGSDDKNSEKPAQEAEQHDHEGNNEAVKNDSVHLTDSEKCSHAQVLASSRICLESGEDVNNDSDAKNCEKPAQEAEQHDHESNNEAVKNDPVHLTDSEKCSHAQVLASSRISLESGEDVNNDSDDKNCEKPAQEAEHHHDHESNNKAVKNDSVHLTDSEKCSHAQVLASCSISLEIGENVNNDSDDKNSEKPSQEAEQYDKFCSAQGDQDESCVTASILPEHNLGTDVKDNAEEDKNEKICDQNKKGEVSLSNVSNISNELVDNHTPGSYSMTQEGSSPPKKSFDENIIENVLGFSLASSTVDFEIPVLDVKFISQKSPTTMGFLESLLVETPKTSPRNSPVKESIDDHSVVIGNGDLSVEEHSYLISVDDGEPVNPASTTDFIMDEVLYTSTIPPLNTEGDNLPEDRSNLISVDNGESASHASNNDFILDEVLSTSTIPLVDTEGDNLLEDHKRKHDQISTSSLI